MMTGAASLPEPAPRASLAPSPPMLAVEALTVLDDKALTAVRELSLAVGAGEILGVAGVSGNGQRELVETLAGQRRPESGIVRVRSEEHTSELQSQSNLVCRLLLEKKKKKT